MSWIVIVMMMLSSCLHQLSAQNCSNPTLIYPVFENFESTIQYWSQDTGDDFNWSWDSGGTPSSGTGPTSGYNGSTGYIYIEASSPNYPSKVASLVSPCLQLGTGGASFVSFAYHMLGDGIGSLHLDISTNNGGTWTNLWTRSGNQGSNWLTSTVDLNSYEGQILQLRFRGISNTWQSDIALDDVLISSKPGFSPELCYFIADGASDGGTEDIFYTFNYKTGIVATIGSTGTYYIEAMAMDTVSNTIYTVDGDDFGTINIQTGQFNQISSDVGNVDGSLGTININDIDGMTYDNVNNVIWASERRSGGSNGEPDDLLLQIDPLTGLAVQNAFGPNIDYVVVYTAENDLDDIAMSPNGTLYAISNYGSSGNQAFGIINKTNGVWTVIGDYGVQDVESLGFTKSGQMIATSGKDGSNANELYTIDAGTGVATYIGSIAPGSDVEACDCVSSTLTNLQLGDRVWEDADKDGLQDIDEPGVPNVVVNLLYSNGSAVLDEFNNPRTTITNASGLYLFDGLEHGGYRIEFILPNGANFSAANVGSDDAIDSDVNISTGISDIVILAGSANNYTVDAGMQNTGIVVRDCDNAGELFVADDSGNIKRYNQNTGAFIDNFITGLSGPLEMAVGNDNWLYISNSTNDQIRKYSLTTGVLIDTYTSNVDNPNGITIGADGYLYVSNDDDDNVIKMNVSNGSSSVFVSSGSGGLDGNKNGIAFGPNGNLFITSYEKDNVKRYNGSTGAYISDFFAKNTNILEEPTDLVFGPDGHLYVTGRKTNNVVKYNGTTGAYMSTFVTNQSGGLMDPYNLVFGNDGNLYVSSKTNNIGVLKYNGTTGAYISKFVSPTGPNGLLFAPVPGCEYCPEVQVYGDSVTCFGEAFVLTSSVTGGQGSCGYQWESSLNGSTWMAIGGATGSTLSVSSINSDTYYRLGYSCSGSTICGAIYSTVHFVKFNSELNTSISTNGDDCLREDSQLSADVSGGSTPYFYNWNGPSSFTSTLQTIDISQSGTYNVTVTDSYGCTDVSSTFVYNAYEPFISTLNTNVCEGDQVNLSVSSASTVGYQWGANAGNATTSSVNVTPLPPSTTYNVTVTNNIGCTADASLTITVDPRTVVNITGPDNLCIGETSSLSPSSGGTWTSSNPSVATVANDGTVTGLASGTASFIFTETSTNCESLPTSEITVKPKPAVAVTGPSAICEGFTTNVSPNTGGTWTSSNPSIATVQNNGTVTAVSPGSVTFIFTNSDTDCPSDATQPITVNGRPVVTIVGPNNLCIGETSSVSPTTGGSWTSSNPSVATVANNGTVTAISAGTATFVFTDGTSSCASFPTNEITVKPKPTVSVTGPTSICEGFTTNLSPSTGGTWVSSNTNIATVTNNGTVTGVSPGTATFTFTNSTTNCPSNATQPVTIDDVPTVAITGANKICEGSTTSLSPSTGGTWQSSNPSVATVTNAGIVMGVSNGTATFTFTSSVGCVSQPTAVLTVDPPSNVSISGDDTICENETTTLTASNNGGTWSSGNTAIATISSSGLVTAISAGSVIITYSHNSGACSESPTFGMTILANPVVTNSGSSELCVGDNVQLNTTGSGGSWVSSNSSVATISSSGLVVGVSAGTATFIHNSGNGCSSSPSNIITVHPQIDVSIGLNGSECLRNDSQLSAEVSGGTATFNYQWAGPNGFSSTLQTIDINQDGHYYVTVTDAKGCSSNATAFVYETYVPNISTLNTNVCEGDVVNLLVNASSPVAYQWGPNAGNATSSSVNVTPSPPSTTYNVTVTNNIGCTAVASSTITVDARTVVSVTGPSEICEGFTTTLAPTTGGTWESTNPAVAIVSNDGTVTGISAGNTTFVFTEGSTGCESLPTTEITIKPKPIVAVTGPTSICEGFTTTLTPTSGGTWTSSDNGIATVQNNGTVTGVSVGTVTFTFTNSATNCPSDASEQITVNEVHTVSIEGSDNLCIGETSQLSPNSGGTWTSSNASIASVTNGGLVTGVSSGSATFSFTSSFGCVSQQTSEIVVNPDSIVTINGLSVLCEEETTTLTASHTGGVWTSGNNSIATINSSGIVTAVMPGNVSIYYTTPTADCRGNATHSLEVKNTPTISISGSTELCVGDLSLLSTSGSGGYWTSSDDDVAIVSNNGIVVGMSGGTATFTYTSSNGCASNESEIITVHPEVNVMIDFNGSVCLKEDSQLSAVVSGGTPNFTYQWTGPGGFSSASQTVDIDLDGNYQVTVTDGKGCSTNTTAFVYESYEPFIFTLNTTVCEGDQVDLSVNSNTATDYLWSANAGSSTSSSVTVTPEVPNSTYNVTVTNNLGCTTTASATINVNPRTSVSISGPTEICIGDATNVSPSTGGSWTSSNPSVATVSNDGTVVGVSAGTATFVFTDSANSCESLPTTAITVHPKPSISVTGPSSICVGFNTTLSPTTGGTWASSNINIATVDNDGIVTGINPGNATFIFTSFATNCPSNASQAVSVNEIPIVSIIGSNEICIGDITQLSPSSGGTWTSSNSSIATVSNFGVVTGVSAGTATFTFTSSYGCVSEQSSNITIRPDTDVIISGASALCQDEVTTLTASHSGGTWSTENPSIATINSSGVVTAIGAGSVTILYSSPPGECNGNATFVIQVKTKPVISVFGSTSICVGDNTFLSTSGSGGYWTSSNSNIAIISSSGVVVGISAGTATFTYTSGNGCTSDASEGVVVHPEVDVTIGFNGSVCLEEDSQLSAIVSGGTANFNYQWTGPGGFSSNLQTIDIALHGNYNVVVTDASGCSTNTTAYVYEAYEPFIFTLNTTVCEGQSVSLSVNSNTATNYQWGPNAGNSTNQSVTVTPSVPSTGYIVTVTNNHGCTTTASAEISVDPKPIVSVTGPSTICQTGSTQLSPSSGGTWTSSNYAVASVNNSGLVTGFGPGSVTFTFNQQTTGCSSNPTTPVQVIANGTINLSGPNYMCLDQTETYTASVPGGTWQSSVPSVATIDAAGVVSSVTIGTTTISYTAPSGECYNVATRNLEIKETPVVSLNGPSEICKNDQTYLTSSIGGGTWSSSNSAIATVTSGGVVTGVSEGTATFTYTSSFGCSETLDTPISVIEAPPVSLNGPSSICINGTTSLLPNSGGVWMSNNNNVATVSSAGIVTAVAAGSVSFTFIESTLGCASEELIYVVVNPNPSINGILDNNLCIGETTTITPSSGGTWSSSNSSIATINNFGQITAVNPGTATFTYTKTSTGCTSSPSAPLTVHGTPVIEFSGPTSVCIGETSNIIPSSGGYWSTSNVSIATITSSGLITGVAPGQVQFIYTNNATGCKSDSSQLFTVDEPTPASISGPDHICIGYTTNLLPNSGGTWTSSNTNIATVTNNGLVSGKAPGTVSFMFDSNSGCSSNTSLNITVDPNPTTQYTGPTAICIGSTTNASPTSGGTWTSSNPAVATIDNSGLITAITQGTALFTFQNSTTGCSSTLNTPITIYTSPSAEITGADAICIGSTTTMIPSSGGTWTSSNSAIATITTNGIVTGNTAGFVTFTFTESGSACTSAPSDTVTILPKPVVSITGPNAICAGSTTTLSPTTGGSWASNNTGVATVSSNGTVTGVAQGIAKFIFTSDSGCASNQSAPISVFNNPETTLVGSSDLCIGETAQILPSSGGSWVSDNPSVASITNGGIITAISSGEVRFTYTDNTTLCISEASEPVTVLSKPVTSINGPSEICIGGLTNMTPTTGGTWTSTNTNIATIQNNGSVLGISPGQVRFLFVSSTSGCTSDTSSIITVVPGPPISYTGPTSLCIGETTSLSPMTGGTWTSNKPSVATINNSGIVTAISQGTAKFRFTESSSGCSSVLSSALTVNGPPAVVIAGNNQICIGTTTQLTPSTGGTWVSTEPTIASVSAGGLVTGISSGISNFIFTDGASGCSSEDDLSVTVQVPDDIVITGDDIICIGYTTTLTPASGGFWTSSNPKIATISNFGVVTAKTPGVVTFNFVDSATGCSANGPSDPITVIPCLNNDFNVSIVNLLISGNINTNDNVPGSATYSTSPIVVSKPLGSIYTLNMNASGSYTFVANKKGKYLFAVPVCIPPLTSGCPRSYLEINVADQIYTVANPISNLEYSTTYSDSNPALVGQAVEINALANDKCILTSGCDLDPSTLTISDTPSNGSASVDINGIITYIPNAGFIGKDTLDYMVCVDGSGGSNCGTSRQVIIVNDPTALNSVIAADDFNWTLKEIETLGNVLLNDSDPEGNAISVVAQGDINNPITTAAGEYYINANGEYSFTSNENFFGSTEIVYTICDDAAIPECTDATLHILVFDDISLTIRVYLEGALMQNSGLVSSTGRPLMRDNLRVSPYTGQNYIPMQDPYSVSADPYVNIPAQYNTLGPGLLSKNRIIADSLAVFSVSGENAIVDWVHIELRSKDDYTIPIATRAALLQRDGDVVDLDGTSKVRFQGVNVDSFYLVIKHRSHLGVMTQKVANDKVVDFTSLSFPNFNFGNDLDPAFDYTGLSQKSTVKTGFNALWGGDFDSNGKVKFTNPGDDQNVLFIDVLFGSPGFLINYDNAYGYLTGDYNMNSKAKYTNPQDDLNYLFSQILLYQLNTSFLSNFNAFIEQVPSTN